MMDQRTAFWITVAVLAGLYALWELTISRVMFLRGKRRMRTVHGIHKIIGVAPKTQLRCIVRHEHSWVVWTGIADMQVPAHKWTGTYIQLLDNGTALRVVVQPDGVEETIRIM